MNSLQRLLFDRDECFRHRLIKFLVLSGWREKAERIFVPEEEMLRMSGFRIMRSYLWIVSVNLFSNAYISSEMRKADDYRELLGEYHPFWSWILKGIERVYYPPMYWLGR